MVLKLLIQILGVVFSTSTITFFAIGKQMNVEDLKDLKTLIMTSSVAFILLQFVDFVLSLKRF
jgi:hypothetical protein